MEVDVVTKFIKDEVENYIDVDHDDVDIVDRGFLTSLPLFYEDLPYIAYSSFFKSPHSFFYLVSLAECVLCHI